MPHKPHYFFEALSYEQVIAHDGCAPIHFHRALERGRGTECNFVDFSILPVGSSIGRHAHSMDNEEIYIIISGAGLMWVDGREFPVAPGHVIINRPGGSHGLTNTGNVELRMVVIEVPVSKGSESLQGD
jgi:mannose-6-phosphate isomerase-like protein (cupin superfamily)